MPKPSPLLDTRVIYCGEIDAFFRREHVAIVPLTVRDILDEQIARKLV